MDKDPVSQNVEGVRQLVTSKLNKLQDGASSEIEGIVGDFEHELDIDLSEEELLALSKQWEAKYMPYEAKIKPRQNANKNYYLGKQQEGSSVATNGLPIASNILFEAVETFLPAALAKNPEPVVYSDNSKEGNTLSDSIKTMLQYHADALEVRRKLAEGVRSWTFNYLGVWKYGWDDEIKDIKFEVRNPQNFIFNPDCTVDAYGDMEGYVGERITVTAGRLAELFPKHKDYISLSVDGHMGSDVLYTQWWNDDYSFSTYKMKVLEKVKNPHFNYAQKVNGLDEQGQPVQSEQLANNHFAKPKKPYTFLSVFSLGDQPHDITGLIEQNIPNQNRITKRETQIDVNLDRSNNSIALSENNFDQEKAKQAAMAMQRGNPILVPGGNITEAIARFPAPAIPDAVFKASDRDKQDLRSIFGTEGISSQPQDKETTARGMILNQQFDNSRIGGGIGDSIEGVAKSAFNWFLQMYYVYYDEPHFAAIMGQMKAVEYITLSTQDLNKKIIVSVSPDSMKPHDEITQMNQALSLWEAQALDPKTLLTMLNFPDPQDTAEQTVLWLIDKNAYLQLNFPELAQQLAQVQQINAQATAQANGGAGQPSGAPIQGESNPSISVPPAGSSLSQVPLNSLPQ